MFRRSGCANFSCRDHGRYRVRKEIREKVLFAAHNVLKDAPFSRCDLISCRNLLIYLNAEAQQAVFDIFHFALRSGGLLFLGGAENHGQAQIAFLAARREAPALRAPLDAAADLESAGVAGRVAAHCRRRDRRDWRTRPLPPLTHEVGGSRWRALTWARCTRGSSGARCSSASCICVCSSNTGRPRWS